MTIPPKGLPDIKTLTPRPRRLTARDRVALVLARRRTVQQFRRQTVQLCATKGNNQ